MKVVSYDPSDAAGPSGPLSGTSCPPQPCWKLTQVFCCDPWDICGRLVCMCVAIGSFILEIPTNCSLQ